LEKSGQWQKQTPAERRGWIMHMTEEHMMPEQAGEMARDAGVKTLVLSHVGGGAPGDDFARFATRAGKAFKGRIIVAKDLMSITP
jgi:ribonuclease BN (tRNA processing enzyme)